ncbi:hypothetical protein FB451DRAFT_1551383 [Mycena latifolia]|nr:hypothetical protein FB451DRAFT_1551383 [Mycena latifolia]
MNPNTQESPSTHIPTVRDRPTRAALRARKVELDAKIVAMELEFIPVLFEQETLERQLAYPVDTLPNEIVSEIFVSFIPAYPDPAPLHGPSSPVVLGQICRTWREIAFSTPALWRAIKVFLADKKDFDTQLDILNTWLQRSRSCPFSIPPSTLGTILAPFWSAWRRLSGHSSPIAPGGMSCIYSYTPYFFERSPGESSEGTFIAFASAPNLHAVNIIDPFTPSLMTLPWSQLTTLTIKAFFEFEVYRVLKHAAALVYFETTLLADPALLPLARAEDVPPLLYTEVLILGGVDLEPNSEHSRILQKLTLPALRTLEISLIPARTQRRRLAATQEKRVDLLLLALECPASAKPLSFLASAPSPTSTAAKILLGALVFTAVAYIVYYASPTHLTRVLVAAIAETKKTYFEALEAGVLPKSDADTAAALTRSKFPTSAKRLCATPSHCATLGAFLTGHTFTVLHFIRDVRRVETQLEAHIERNPLASVRPSVRKREAHGVGSPTP